MPESSLLPGAAWQRVPTQRRPHRPRKCPSRQLPCITCPGPLHRHPLLSTTSARGPGHPVRVGVDCSRPPPCRLQFCCPPRRGRPAGPHVTTAPSPAGSGSFQQSRQFGPSFSWRRAGRALQQRAEPRLRAYARVCMCVRVHVCACMSAQMLRTHQVCVQEAGRASRARTPLSLASEAGRPFGSPQNPAAGSPYIPPGARGPGPRWDPGSCLSGPSARCGPCGDACLVLAPVGSCWGSVQREVLPAAPSYRGDDKGGVRSSIMPEPPLRHWLSNPELEDVNPDNRPTGGSCPTPWPSGPTAGILGGLCPPHHRECHCCSKQALRTPESDWPSLSSDIPLFPPLFLSHPPLFPPAGGAGLLKTQE